MPGLNLIASHEALDQASVTKFDRIQQAMLHRASYSYRALAKTDHICMGLTGYQRYPIRIIEPAGFIVCLEGMIYNKSSQDIDNELNNICKNFCSSHADELDGVRRFVETSDGEFLVVISFPDQDRVLAFNDSMGKLPAYFHHHQGRFMLSREVKFILPFLKSANFDSAGLMEYLLFGFTFGSSTLIEGVSYMRPGSVLSFSIKNGELVTCQEPLRNFERTMWPSRERAVAEMKTRFLSAMDQRVASLGKCRAVVSLSGGLDSRGTLAGLVSAKADVVAVTTNSPEQACASEVADALGVEIRVLSINQQNSDFDKAVFLKDGLDCHPGLGNLYLYPQSIEEELGENIVYFTGIYGGEITRYRNPTASLGSTSELVEYLLSAPDHYKYSTGQVCKLLMIDRKDVVRHLTSYLSTLPEQSPLRKYIHFRHEFDLKYAGEAEDRNRYYFWTISPYFSEPFFVYAMSLDENKKDTALFRDFLYSIDRRTCNIKYFNFNLPMKYRSVLTGLSVGERLVRIPALKAAARRVIQLKHRIVGNFINGNRIQKDSVALGCPRARMSELARSSPLVKKNFDVKSLEQVINTETDGQGLERIRIVLTYGEIAETWHRRFNAEAID